MKLTLVFSSYERYFRPNYQVAISEHLKESERRGAAGLFLCSLPSSAIHHQVERLFTAGVKVPGACLRALSEEPLLLKRTASMQRPHLRSYLTGPHCPGAKKKPISTRVSTSSPKWTFKAYLMSRYKANFTIDYLSPLAVLLVLRYLCKWCFICSRISPQTC